MDLCLQGVGQKSEAGTALGIERGAYGDDGLHDVYALHLPHALAYYARGGRGPRPVLDDTDGAPLPVLALESAEYVDDASTVVS